MKHRTLLIILFLLTASCQNIPTRSNYASYDNWMVECSSKELKFHLPEYLYSELNNTRLKNNRCEVANRKLLKLDKDFVLGFSFIPLDVSDDDKFWHSVFQIHSFPDLKLGESWRCPISALEVVNGQLRMFNRWDDNKISILEDLSLIHI